MGDTLCHDLIGSIYDGAMDTAHWRRALDLMASLNGGGDGAMLIVGDPETAVLPDAGTLAVTFGLSPTEAKLLSLLLADMSLIEASERLQLSVESQRVRLKRIFAKTGTNRQSELIGLALRLPALRHE
jgi:DNA-binding CsgD family transcriptional regulator